MKTITFKHPILIDGETVSTVTYDIEEITVGDYKALCERHKIDSQNPKIPQTDCAFLFGLGVTAILAVNRGNGWTHVDFERLKGHDIWQVTSVGYRFFSGAEDEQPEDSSEPQ